jgi:methyl-accepting chemotaxis protein
MTVFQILFNDIFLLVLIVGLLICLIFVQRRVEMRIANIQAAYDVLLESKEGVDKKDDSEETLLQFKRNIDERMNTHSLEVGEVAKRVQVLGEKIEVAMKDVDKKLASQKTPTERAPEGLNAVPEGLNKILEKNENEMKQVVEAIKKITAEMKHMRDAIREKTIDFEL